MCLKQRLFKIGQNLSLHMTEQRQVGVPVGRVQQDGIYLALLLNVRLEVPVHQASSDAACQLLRLQLAWILTSHLRLTHEIIQLKGAGGRGEGG